MVQLGGECDLEKEPLSTEYGSQVGPEHLDRHFSVVLEVACEIYGCHAAVPKLALEHVAILESGNDRGGSLDRHMVQRRIVQSAGRTAR